jgi:5-oxoprolinase (ATP-hydrolysing)
MDILNFQKACDNLQTRVSSVLLEQGIKNFAISFEVDLRFHGQATNLPVSFEQQEIVDRGFVILEDR